ncbi:C40 family peptidase [Konateibacter massiliensis]|uniref:C40 family peptidase n=1 Tax=Konateibacter massiliensis TaxID=2002841 RepID=UPI000C147786|nr:C40 family peptidase [Konateibacter massiliensis]
MKKFVNTIIILSLVTAMFAETAFAATSSEIKKQKEQTESSLNSIKNNINSLEKKKANMSAQISETNSKLVDVLVVIQVLEEDMANKELEIEQAQADYDEAKAKEEEQYEAMKKRIKYMYEQGNTMYLEALLEADSLSDLLNKAEYVNDIYNYDRQLLTDFQETKQQVADYQVELDNQKEEMVALEADYKEQQANLEDTIATMQAQVEDFDTQLSSAKAQAKSYQDMINKQSEQIKQLAAAEKKAAEEAAKKAVAQQAKNSEKSANTTSNTSTSPGGSSSDSSSSDSGSSGSGTTGGSSSSSGSGTGSSIASYATQFIGNPYVLGGTSLTNGADCSGFTQSVYAHFGISIPRTSGEQASSGSAVSFSEIQPGDIVCYAGHVAIYIGNGQIVHASTPATGIKYGNVTYRTILSIRRYY